MSVTLSDSSPPSRPPLFGLTRASLGTGLVDQGYPRYRADQIFTWLYQKHLRAADGMRNLPATLRDRIASTYDLQLPSVASVHSSRDDMTHKFVIELEDGARVECVSMRTEKRLTFCLSSQAGCALGCTFCATGLMGLKRNLRAHEIIGQVLRMGDFHQWKDPRFNLVFMGMGEPLANYEAVVGAVRILHDERGLNLGARRITVSTSGVIPGIRRLAEEGLQIGLALSLHATDDDLRDRLVPINKRWPIAELIEAARFYGEKSGRRVTLEYTLMAGVNDRPEDAQRLAALARSLPSKINLIPYNPVPGLSWKRPSREAVEGFVHRLYPVAPAVTVRHTMGGEIWAACGQLGGLTPAT